MTSSHASLPAPLLLRPASLSHHFRARAIPATSLSTRTAKGHLLKTRCAKFCVRAHSDGDPRAASDDRQYEHVQISRRGTLAAAALGLYYVPFGLESALADELSTVTEAEATAMEELKVEDTISTVFVAGATGASGQQVVRSLKRVGGVNVIAGARNVEKAQKLGLDTAVRQIDVTSAPEVLVKALQGADAVVCAVGFVPGNPFKWAQAAHLVDNLGTKNLVDAAKLAGVKRFVLISSILTNGRAIGQEKSPGFVITNAFGGVLDEKLEAEQYLRASGLDYVILRPGGLKDGDPTGALSVALEDTFFAGEISRELVGAAAANAVFDPMPANKVLEMIEVGSCPPGVCPLGNTDPSVNWYLSRT